jgi:esterase/lipase
MRYAKTIAEEISLFACSMGAYFSLLSYQNEPIKQSLFLSPVVNMERIIQHLMTCFDVREERLKAEKEIQTPIGQTLYWDYYCYVQEHPIVRWNVPTDILYGRKDDLCDYDVISSFAKDFSCKLELMEEGEHYFHTPEQLAFLQITKIGLTIRKAPARRSPCWSLCFLFV